MIDSDGFRPNVAMVVCNRRGRVLWCRRAGRGGWQFPQGGIMARESPEQALYRELDEEIGLSADDVRILHRTRDWLRYRIPENRIRRRQSPLCIGQKQKWFLLGLEADDARVALDRSDEPEFDRWEWVNYWHPADRVVDFKRAVYRRALRELAGPLDDYVRKP